MAYVTVGGGLNTYVPSTNALATGALQVEFTRAVNSFAITRYAQIVACNQQTGYYLRLDSDDNVRVTDLNEFVWPLGNDRPVGKMNQHDFVTFTAVRYAFPFYIPNETVKQAAWDIVAQHARSKAQLAMTARSMRTATALTGSAAVTAFTAAGNYYATGTANSGVGAWTASTGNNIQKGVQTALQRISLATGGAVRSEDICLVISPTIANALSQTAEVRDYVKNYAAGALPFLQGGDIFSRYGLPPNLFGVSVVVDDSVKVTSRKNNAVAGTRSFVYGNSAIFVSRPGGLVGVEGSTSFSTCQIFAFEDMTVENWDDPKDRRIEGRVIDNSTSELVAPVSGVLVADVTS